MILGSIDNWPVIISENICYLFYWVNFISMGNRPVIKADIMW